jgi:glycerophosphoryl diester phosphodiesterase
MIQKNLLFFICLLLIFTVILACNKDYGPTKETSVIFIGHKGGGGNLYNDINMENTISAMKEGVKYLDGVETDLQMSRDGTIWMYHDTDLASDFCDKGPRAGIIFQTDSVISTLYHCHRTKKDRLYKLSELIDLWDSNPNFYISLEVKTSWTIAEFDRMGGKNPYLAKLAYNLAKALNNSNAQEKMLIEIDSKFFCDRLKTYKSTQNIKTSLIRGGDMRQNIKDALELGYSGISCDFENESVTAENVKEAQQSGLIVQLWTPYYQKDLTSVFQLQPDFIQTDNVKAKRFLNVR